MGGCHVEPRYRYTFLLKNKLIVGFDYYYLGEKKKDYSINVHSELIATFKYDELLDIKMNILIILTIFFWYYLL